MTPEARIAELEAENAALREQVCERAVVREQVRERAVVREQVAALAARVAELRARLAKDSRNSSKPPASAGPKRKRTPKSLRQRSGKKAGGQLGHRGETLHLVAVPDAVVEHRPAVCAQCQSALDEAAVVRHERRQMWDRPQCGWQITEHRALHVRCPPRLPGGERRRVPAGGA